MDDRAGNVCFVWRSDAGCETPLRVAVRKMARSCFTSHLQLKKAVRCGRIIVDGVVASSPNQLLEDGANVECQPVCFAVRTANTAVAQAFVFAGDSPAPLCVAVSRQEYCSISATALNRALKQRLVHVDGREATSRTQMVEPGARVEVFQADRCNRVYRQRLEVVFEDDELAVVVKPAGLPADSRGSCRTVASVLPFTLKATTAADPLPVPAAVHRLDASVGGLLISAKTERAARALSVAFAARTVRKEYRALLAGQLMPSEGAIELALDGKPAKTVYNTLHVVESLRFGPISEVVLWPHTGRAHQLRRHTAACGAPIIGDTLYFTRGHGKTAAKHRGLRMPFDLAKAEMSENSDTADGNIVESHMPPSTPLILDNACVFAEVAGAVGHGSEYDAEEVLTSDERPNRASRSAGDSAECRIGKALMLWSVAVEFPHPDGAQRAFRVSPPLKFEKFLKSEAEVFYLARRDPASIRSRYFRRLLAARQYEQSQNARPSCL